MSRGASEVSREEACRLLGMSPKSLRSLWQRYAAVLGGGRVPSRLTRETVERLRRIRALQAAGRGDADIVAALTLAAEETAATVDPLQEVEARLAEIAQRLAVSETRRAQEHDRLVTSLMRTQQELNHLRYEVAASVPRRQRRSGLVARMFGGTARRHVDA